MNVRVLKRAGQWHWWCRTCMGGDWNARWGLCIRGLLRSGR